MDCRLLFPACLLAVLPASGAMAATAQTFQATLDVSADITISTAFEGNREGNKCPAPFEKGDFAYHLDFESGPARSLKPVVAFVNPTSASLTFSSGVPGGAQKRATKAAWDLTLANTDPTCGPAPTLPAWVSSPTCKPISEFVVPLWGREVRTGATASCT